MKIPDDLTCDGLIVSTATGSTGYALAVSSPSHAAGAAQYPGHPDCAASEHGPRRDSVEGSTVRLRLQRPSIMLTVDGRVVVRGGGEHEIVVVGSPHRQVFVRAERSYFYQTLMDKMQWTI